MENKDISQIALETIKEKGIKPISKKFFDLKKVIFWSLAGFFVVMGSVSFSVLLFVLCNNDWYLYNKFGISFILKSLPYFWAICLLLVASLGGFYYRKTPFGYRPRTITIVSVYILLTVVSGTVLHTIGMGEIVEKSLFEKVPVYRIFVMNKNDMWHSPENGLLSGRIISIDGEVVRIIDFDGNIWSISMGDTLIDKKAKIEVGETLKIIGDTDNDADDIFKANEIHSWIGGKIDKDCCTVRQ